PAGPVPAGPVPVVRELPAVAAAFTVHARIAGPFATVAVEAPAVDQAMAFALAVEVLRARAAVQFRPHFDAAAVPYEARAQAPVVYYRWLEGDPCLFVTRRGADRAAFEPTLAEARSLLAGGHSQPATPAELAAAVQVLQREQALPPFAAGLTAALAAAPAGLAGRVRTLALYGWRGWRPARVTEMAAVPAAEVQRSLDRMAECASDCACGLLPGTPPPAAR
ncbi:MAG TPA: hypothetical protein VK348_05335, partial [Planctomycetota bacterium]|nr:hypothetical protein [Planctomycetota bacterium]